jgi:RND family efflux transporter MFP subunit
MVRNKIFKIMAPILVIVAGIAGFQVLHATKPEPEKTDEGVRPVSLFVEKAQTDDLALTVDTSGEVRPRTEIDLVAQVSGQIISVSRNFVAGGSVIDGATLIKIEDADYRLAVTQAEAQVAAAETRVELSEASAEIARRNWDDNIVGKPTPLALKLPQLAEARANLRAAEAELESARLKLARTNITVPFNGRVRTKMADVGQYVSAGTLLGRVYSTDIAEIRLPLTDAQMATLGLPFGYEAEDGKGPRVIFDALVAGKSRSWEGRIVRTEAAVDAATRVLYVVAEVRDPYGDGADNGMPMAIGLYVNARIDGSELTDVLVIPRSALRSADKVYVVAEDGTLDIRTVEIGYTDRDRVVVTHGLSDGEQVVVSTVRSPRQGMAVVALDRGSVRQAATDHLRAMGATP